MERLKLIELIQEMFLKNNFLTSSYELDQFIKKFSQHTFMRTLLLRFKVNFQAFTTDRSDKVISFVYKHKRL